MTQDDGRVFTVVHEDGRPWTNDDLEQWALDHDDAHLVYCDMAGFLIDEYGELMISDECGSFVYVCETPDMHIVWNIGRESEPKDE